MASASYMAGVLSALVKSGEISPAYATGFFDGLEKRAWTGMGHLFRSKYQNYNEAQNDILKERQKQYGKDYQLTAKDRDEALDRSHFGWDGAGFWPTVGNRTAKFFSPLMNWAGFSNKDKAWYDNDLAAQNAKARAAYRAKYIDPQEKMHMTGAAQVQEQNNQAVNAGILDAKRLGMSDEEIKARYGSAQVGQHYGTDVGNAAMAGGLYKTDYEHAGPKPGSTTTGAGIAAQVGTPGSHRVDGLGSTDYIWQDGGRVG